MSAGAESSFRSSLSGFKWANATPAAGGGSLSTPANGPGDSTTWNPFSTFTSSLSSYVPLRSSERTNEEEAFLALSRWERLIGFMACMAGASVCFTLSFFLVAFLAIKPRKFAVSFSAGSLLFMLGFMILQGPMNYLKFLLQTERLPFTIAYLGSLVLTLYFAVARHAFLGTLICAIIQVGALVIFLFSYFPGGTQTILFGGRIALRGASSLLPV
ncbi:uncharacterized protein L969DRAFT_92295 [Mixia osmundae IAM 14324]|uniref:Protein transport protein SFT2 n=1 Tax=Mixia osmundae (strain CBS 9802 / IAM 14324 / JCM 22182 / KY 12970) TaxID=764103 RepID=G7DTD8_MIXOS|nr:uncharacterized protein L969DRAFT_92295 [Mixia osmundae IAM 14324]KEI42878.1 hypothetical protein L969DRAFT_92295 [Mixia osmundae IAM 14324]GAA93785.1 hypothetical protein E5Q_00431 [Mixia osmundae IAM 14324]